MGSYVLVYVGGSQPASEEEGKAVMEAWTSWFGALGDAVADAGNPFGPSASVAADGTVGDTGSVGATGYSIITATDLATAVDLAKGCPQLAAGGVVDVYETFDVM